MHEGPAGASSDGAAPVSEPKAKEDAAPQKASAASRLNPSFTTLVRKRWRGWLRSIHRDVGYLAVGLTVIYAVSGLAINHLQDWDPNFTGFQREYTIAPIGADVPDAEAVARVREALHLGVPRDVYRAGDELHLTYDGRTVVVYGDSGQVTDQGQSPRFFLRVANWLHYNRGKKAWTYIADGYAVLLLYLAISGLFMIKGKLGLRWRGLLLAGLGAGIPTAYVLLSGGPNANERKTADASAVAPSAGDDGDDNEPIERPAPRATTPGPATDTPGDDGDDDEPIERPPVRTPPR
ncbi:MAG: hypothetical protein R3B48_14910 [Kofleriaceae bacterium]